MLSGTTIDATSFHQVALPFPSLGAKFGFVLVTATICAVRGVHQSLQFQFMAPSMYGGAAAIQIPGKHAATITNIRSRKLSTMSLREF